ncbi:C39 family peptidase [Candidatus Altiarchaeota archaeon]
MSAGFDLPPDSVLKARCGKCNQSVFTLTEGCDDWYGEAWYAFINITKFGVGPIFDTTLIASDPNVLPDLCAHPDSGLVWQPGDNCTIDDLQYESGTCGPACYCDIDAYPNNNFAGKCEINTGLGSQCGEDIFYTPTNVGDYCWTDWDCGPLCYCSSGVNGSHECERSPWSIPSRAKGTGVVYNSNNEPLNNSLEILPCFLRVLRVWNNGSVDYYDQALDWWWECEFDENGEIYEGTACSEIVGLSIQNQSDILSGEYLPLIRIDRAYETNENFTAVEGDCYDPLVNQQFSGNPCFCMCAKAGFDLNWAPYGAYCKPPSTPACSAASPGPEWTQHVVGGDSYCHEHEAPDYQCCCRGESALAHLSENFNRYVAVDSMYINTGFLGDVLGISETQFFDVVREIGRLPEARVEGHRDYYRTYTLARSCDILGAVDDDAKCKSETIKPDFNRQFQGLLTPNYYADIEEEGYDDCTWKLIDGGKFCEYPGVYVKILNKSRAGTNLGYSNYVILGEENLSMRRIYNESISDGEFLNKNDVLEWNWWAGHRLLGCDLCLPGDRTCSMGSSIAMWYNWLEADDPRGICGFYKANETWKPDEDFVGDSVHSIKSRVSGNFIRDTDWNGKCAPGQTSPNEEHPSCRVDEDNDQQPDGFECFAYETLGEVEYANPTTPGGVFGMFYPVCMLPWQNDFFTNEGGGNVNWLGGGSEQIDFTYTDPLGNTIHFTQTVPLTNFEIDSGWGVVISDMVFLDYEPGFNYSDYPEEGDCNSELMFAMCFDNDSASKQAPGLSELNEETGLLEEVIINCNNQSCISDLAECLFSNYFVQLDPGPPVIIDSFPYVYGGESPYTYQQTVYDQNVRTDSFWEGVELSEFQTSPLGFYEEMCTVPGFDNSGWLWYVFKHAGVPGFEERLTIGEQNVYTYRDLVTDLEQNELAQQVCSCTSCTSQFINDSAMPGDIMFIDPCGENSSVCPQQYVCHVAIYVGDGEIIHAKPDVGLIREAIPEDYFDHNLVGIESVYRPINLPQGNMSSLPCAMGIGGALPPQPGTGVCHYADKSCELVDGLGSCTTSEAKEATCPEGVILDAPYVCQWSGEAGDPAIGGKCGWLSRGPGNNPNSCVAGAGCGPVSLSMALDHINGAGPDNVLDFLQRVCQTEAPGCPAGTIGQCQANFVPDEECLPGYPCGCVHASNWDDLYNAAEREGYGYDDTWAWNGGMTIDDVWNSLNEGAPVIAMINHYSPILREYNCKYPPTKSGCCHYVLIVGLSTDRNWITINDPDGPCACNSKLTMPTSAFVEAWSTTSVANRGLPIRPSSPEKGGIGTKTLSGLGGFGGTGGDPGKLSGGGGGTTYAEDCYAYSQAECLQKTGPNGQCAGLLNCDCFNYDFSTCSQTVECFPVMCLEGNDQQFQGHCTPVPSIQKFPSMPGMLGNEEMPDMPNYYSLVQELESMNPLPNDKIQRLPDDITRRITDIVMLGDDEYGFGGVQNMIDFSHLPGCNTPPISSGCSSTENQLEFMIKNVVRQQVQKIITENILAQLPGGEIPNIYSYIPLPPSQPDLDLEFPPFPLEEWPTDVEMPIPQSPGNPPVAYPTLPDLPDVPEYNEDIEAMNEYIEATNTYVGSFNEFAGVWNFLRGIMVDTNQSGNYSFGGFQDAITGDSGIQEMIDTCDLGGYNPCEDAIEDQLGPIPEFDPAAEFEEVLNLGFPFEDLPELPDNLSTMDPLPTVPEFPEYVSEIPGASFIPQLWQCDEMLAPSGGELPKKGGGGLSVQSGPTQRGIGILSGDSRTLEMPIPPEPPKYGVPPAIPDLASVVTGTGLSSPYWCTRTKHKDHAEGPNDPYAPEKWDKKDGWLPEWLVDPYPNGIEVVEGHYPPVYCSEDMNSDPWGRDKNDPRSPYACFDYDLKYYRQYTRDSLWGNVFQLTPEVYTETPSLGTLKGCYDVYDAITGGDNIFSQFLGWVFGGDEEQEQRACMNADNVVARGCWFRYDGPSHCYSCTGEEDQDNGHVIESCENYSQKLPDEKACLEDWCGVGPCEWHEGAPDDKECQNSTSAQQDRCTTDCMIDCVEERCDYIGTLVDGGCWFEEGPYNVFSKCYSCEEGVHPIDNCSNYTNTDGCQDNKCKINSEGNGCFWDTDDEACKEMSSFDVANQTCNQLCKNDMIFGDDDCTLERCEKADGLLSSGCWFTKQNKGSETGECFNCRGERPVRICEDYSQEPYGGYYAKDSCVENTCDIRGGCGWTKREGCLPKIAFSSCYDMCSDEFYDECNNETCTLLGETLPGGCWLDTKSDKCWNCYDGNRPVSGCHDYNNDLACLINPCNIPGGCGWDGEKCLGAANLDIDIWTRSGAGSGLLPCPPFCFGPEEGGGPAWIHAAGGFTVPNEDEAKKIWNERKNFGEYEYTGPPCISAPFDVASYVCIPNPIDLMEKMKDNAISVTHCPIGGWSPLDVVPEACGEICGKSVKDLQALPEDGGAVWTDYETWINTTVDEFVDLGIPTITEIITEGEIDTQDPRHLKQQPFSGNIIPQPSAPWKLLNWFNIEHTLASSSIGLNVTGEYHVNNTLVRQVNTQQCEWRGCDPFPDPVSMGSCVACCAACALSGTCCDRCASSDVLWHCKAQWYRAGCTYPTYLNVTLPGLPGEDPIKAFIPVNEEINDYSKVSFEPYGDHLKIDKEYGSPSAIDIEVGGYVDWQPGEVPLDVKGKVSIKAEPDLINGFDMILPGHAIVEYTRVDYPVLHKLFRTNDTGTVLTGSENNVQEKVFLDDPTKFFMAMGDLKSVTKEGELQDIDWSKPWYHWMNNPINKFYSLEDLYYAQDSIYSWYITLECEDCGFLWFDLSKSIGQFRNYHEDESGYYDLASFHPMPRVVYSSNLTEGDSPLVSDINIKVRSLDNYTLPEVAVVYNDAEETFYFWFEMKMPSKEELNKGFIRVYTPLRYKDYVFEDSLI